jgi:uncharacterized protein YprB with RNaseH-like and TPR domain
MAALSDALRKRLAKINKPTETDAKDPTPTENSARFRERLMRAAARLDARRAGIFPDAGIEEMLGGREVPMSSGVFYLVEPDAATMHPEINAVVDTHHRLHLDNRVELPPGYTPIQNVSPVRWLYLDIETTGFLGVPLFLVGLMVFDGARMRVYQLLARDYAEEAPLLEYLAEQLELYETYITFNGKSFDIPYIRDRYFANALRCRLPTQHLDLLSLSRRRWRDTLPNCKLQTLEKWICGRDRDGDIPGTDIPDTYHLFVRTGNAALLKPIMDHNALDLITMGDLLGYLLDMR